MYKIIFKFVIFLLLFCFTSLYGFSTQSNKNRFTIQEKEWIKKHPKILFGADFSWAPYDFINEKGQYDGIAADFLHLVEQNSGLKIEVKPDVWAKTIEKMKDKNLDGLTCVVKTPQREKYIDFTTSYITMPLAIVTKSVRNDIETIEDLKEKTVAINKGSYLNEWLKANYPDIKLYLTHSNDASLEAVSTSKADAYIGNIAVASYIMTHRFLSNLKIVGNINGLDTKVRFGVQKGNKILLSILQKSFDAISMAQRNKIIKKWYKKVQTPLQNGAIILSQKEKKWIQKHPIVHFVADPRWMPFEAVNKTGTYIGIASDYMKLV